MAESHYSADSASVFVSHLPAPDHRDRLSVPAIRTELPVQARTHRVLPNELGVLPISSVVN